MRELEQFATETDDHNGASYEQQLRRPLGGNAVELVVLVAYHHSILDQLSSQAMSRALAPITDKAGFRTEWLALSRSRTEIVQELRRRIDARHQ